MTILPNILFFLSILTILVQSSLGSRYMPCAARITKA